MKFILVSTAALMLLFSSSCKKEKTENGLSITVNDCLNNPKPCLLKIRHQNGKTEEMQYTASAITVLTDANSTLKIDFIAGTDTLSQEYKITKGIGSISPQMCSGFKFSFISKIIGPNGTSIFGDIKTQSNYSVVYNNSNQSTYISAPLQIQSVSSDYPWRTGYFMMKLKGKSPADLFSASALNIVLSSDTSASFMAFGMYSTDSVNYQHKHFISNSLAVLNVNSNKLLSNNYMECSFSPPVVLPGNFNGLNKPFGASVGTDLLGGTLEIKKP